MNDGTSLQPPVWRFWNCDRSKGEQAESSTQTGLAVEPKAASAELSRHALLERSNCMSLTATLSHWLGEHLATGVRLEQMESGKGLEMAGDFRLDLESRLASE